MKIGNFRFDSVKLRIKNPDDTQVTIIKCVQFRCKGSVFKFLLS